MVDETGQPYAHTVDDPVNAVDPNGLDCGIFSVVCGAYDATAGGVKTAAVDTGRFIAKHHQVIEQVATIAAGAVVLGACATATGGACLVVAAFSPIISGSVGDAVYAEGGGPHTAEGYAMAFATGGAVGAGALAWGGVAYGAAALWAGDLAIGGAVSAFQYSKSPGCHSLGGYIQNTLAGAGQNAPIKLHGIFGDGDA